MKRLNAEIKRYLPTILSLLSCAGVVGTAYVAVKNNEKYKEDIRNLENVGVTEFYVLGESEPYYAYSNDDGISVTKIDLRKEKALIFVKDFCPTFLMGVSTICCILGSGALNQQHQAGLISAYGLLNESYGRYKNKVIEHHGIEEHRKILNEIAFEDRKKVDLYVQGAFSCSSLNSSLLCADDRVYPVHDVYSNRWFKATIGEIIDAEYHLNRNMCLGEVVLVNDYYNFMGLEQTIEGNELGWYLGNEDDYYWIDFSNELAHLPDGTEYIEIFFEYAPTTKWQEEW